MTSRALDLRALGTTGLAVPPLCVGCAPLGDMPATFAYGVGEAQALATIRAAFASPIPFLDTAASYGDGESERRIGLALREVVRERGSVPPGLVIATKADRDLQTGEFTGDQMRRSVERSLRLLGVDRLQLCYLHDPEHIGFVAAMAPGGPVAALRQLHEEGVIQHLGVAGGPIDMMIQFVATGLFEAAISHNRYTLRLPAARSGGAQCGALWLGHPGEGDERLSALYVWSGVGGVPAAGIRHRSGVPALPRATRGGGPAVFAARSAHRFDDRRHEQAGAASGDTRPGAHHDSRRAVAGCGQDVAGLGGGGLHA